MEEFKTLKVSPETHKAISIRADILGIKLQRYVDALLAAALKLEDDQIIDELKQWSRHKEK